MVVKKVDYRTQKETEVEEELVVPVSTSRTVLAESKNRWQMKTLSICQVPMHNVEMKSVIIHPVKMKEVRILSVKMV